jgi:hypothetical protein
VLFALLNARLEAATLTGPGISAVDGSTAESHSDRRPLTGYADPCREDTAAPDVFDETVTSPACAQA